MSREKEGKAKERLINRRPKVLNGVHEEGALVAHVGELLVGEGRRLPGVNESLLPLVGSLECKGHEDGCDDAEGAEADVDHDAELNEKRGTETTWSEKDRRGSGK
jgi:hypothetical protein